GSAPSVRTRGPWSRGRPPLVLLGLIAGLAGCASTSAVDLGAGRRGECPQTEALGPLRGAAATTASMSRLYEQYARGRVSADRFCGEAAAVLAYRQYRDPEKGWSLSYPAGWLVEQTGNVVRLRTPRETPVELTAVVEIRVESPVASHIRTADD